MRQSALIVLGAFLGTVLCVGWLSGFVPWFLLPDASFLAVVYAGLFIPGLLGFGTALLPALLRDLAVSAPTGTLLLSSLSLYFLAREISRRLLIRSESFVLATVAALFLLESLTVVVMGLLAGIPAPSLLWAAQETVRIGWTSVVAVPLFMELSRRWMEEVSE